MGFWGRLGKMGKGWLLGAMLMALPVALAFAQGEDPAGSASVGASAASAKSAAFPAERLSEEFDRLSQKGERRASERVVADPDATPSLASFVGKLTVSLLVILGGIYAASHALKRNGRIPFVHAAGPLKVHARHSLSSKSSVYVVAALDRFLIIGESPQGLSILSQFTDPDENLRLREKWGWDSTADANANSVRRGRGATFGPTLQSHVDELEHEISRLREVH